MACFWGWGAMGWGEVGGVSVGKCFSMNHFDGGM